MNQVKIKVSLVDDSAVVVWQAMMLLLGKNSQNTVAWRCRRSPFAMAGMNKEWPHMVLLDIKMPPMDGITYIKRLMSRCL